MLSQILSGKGAVQIMPFRKLGGKCHFLLRFCTRKRSETYLFLQLFIQKFICDGKSDLLNVRICLLIPGHCHHRQLLFIGVTFHREGFRGLFVGVKRCKNMVH